MERKRRLLEKYDIPLNHLDFAYVKTCTDGREMEKIVHILRSGEEGHYPDLTKCAEDKLRELRPNSRMFRYEEQVLGRDALSPKEWKPIYDWTHDIKTKDSKLATVAANSEDFLLGLPPVRKGGTIKQAKEQEDAVKSPERKSETDKAKQRIKSTDYKQWDKYDADEELLRMDLAEERVLEEVERKNRLNLQKSAIKPEPSVLLEAERVKKLSDVERDKLAEEYRLRGNEYYRAKEYENALKEYDRVIHLNPQAAATAYNNRAAVNMKLQKYEQAIDDCQHCLKLEPDNVKARLRLAQATQYYGRRRESIELYEKVLDLDPDNAVALNACKELRKQLGELPPANATRLQIQEGPGEQKDPKPGVSETKTTKAKPQPKPKPKEKPKEYDLADLVKPNRVVENKWAAGAAGALNKMCGDKGNSKPQQQQQLQQSKEPSLSVQPPEIRLPQFAAKSSGKVLIEEI